MRSGFVSLIGRPNVGKSTLLNALINEKIAITSDKAGTTRNVIQGIYNEKDTKYIDWKNLKNMTLSNIIELLGIVESR